MITLLRIGLICMWSLSVSSATAFSSIMASTNLVSKRHRSNHGKAFLLPFVTRGSNRIDLIVPRGGDQETSDAFNDALTEETAPLNPEPVPTKTTSSAVVSPSIAVAKLAGVLSWIGKSYSHRLESRPILTKSVTAGIIFGLSDYLAQRVEGRGSGDTGHVNDSTVASKLDWTRLLTTTLVGLLYFGPAAHFWYEWIFRLFPSTSLLSTMYKAFWGQVLFGPSFTCIFFATSLLQAGKFSPKAWWQKICRDLPGAWLAGSGYWPIVDLISYSLVPVKLIPLFVNMASLVWTIYLSMVANKGNSVEPSGASAS